MTATLAQILDARLVAVVRHADAAPLPRAIEALVEGGVNIAEVTLTVPGALEVLGAVKASLGDRVVLGVGTVLDAAAAIAAIDAGAAFIVSPILNLEIIAVCKGRGIVVMSGCFTPTEVVAAWNAGADVIKVFPAECLGPIFFKALRGPLPEIRLMPTGGVDLNTARNFLEAGAVCLGVGSQLVDPKLLAAGDFAALTARAREFAAIVRRSV